MQDTPEHDDADLDQAAEADAAAGSDVDSRLRDAQDRLLRTQAELENFRKRSRREYEEAQRYREIDLLRDLLPVLDNAHRAIEALAETIWEAQRDRSPPSNERYLERLRRAAGRSAP